MAKKVEQKEKPAPRQCVCGKEAVIVKKGSKKMVTCPSPISCTGNLWTSWRGSQDEAIVEWNGLVEAFHYQKKRNGE